ncbi:aminoglycoside phosphotransferase family protein [Cuniculiplasma sp. SKW4]|uniref:aminoglycoside phosphotransferase family protein n=1 Tax=Cuniculiplasma sp. SKW4 TaxID=3400171 RepID=UPI003FD55EFF
MDSVIVKNNGWEGFSEDHIMQASKILLRDYEVKISRFVNSGFNNKVLIINNEIVLKFPRNSFSSERLIAEKKITDLLINFPFRFPRYNILSVDKRLVGKYRYIEGYPLRKLKVMNECVKHDFSKYFDYISEFDMTSIQKGHIVINDTDSWVKSQLSLMEKFEDIERTYIDKMYFEFLRNEIRRLETYLSDEDFTLIHGDFYRDNIILQNDLCHISGIIDWGEACSGDIAFDLASLAVDYDLGTVLDLIPARFRPEKEKILKRISIYKKIEPLYTLYFVIKEGRDNEAKILSEEFKKSLQ